MPSSSESSWRRHLPMRRPNWKFWRESTGSQRTPFDARLGNSNGANWSERVTCAQKRQKIDSHARF